MKVWKIAIKEKYNRITEIIRRWEEEICQNCEANVEGHYLECDSGYSCPNCDKYFSDDKILEMISKIIDKEEKHTVSLKTRVKDTPLEECYAETTREFLGVIKPIAKKWFLLGIQIGDYDGDANQLFEQKWEKKVWALSKEKNSNKCKKCGECCRRHPCSLHPGDLSKVANFLGLSVQETIHKYLIWSNDTMLDDCDYKFYLRPITIGEVKDKQNIITYIFYLSGRCIFLDETTNLCKIHPVIPKGGKMWSCYMEISDKNRKIVYTKEKAHYDWVVHPLYPIIDNNFKELEGVKAE